MEKENVNILCLDTATEVCTVALARNGELLAMRENADGQSHAKTLLPYIDEVLKEARIQPSGLSAVAVGMGPGSYTGLRIGASTAKGLCYSLGIPLMAVSTLQIIAAGAAQQSGGFSGVFCPLLDARRMEVFTAVYNAGLQEVESVSAQIVGEETFARLLAENEVIFCGNGMEKCRSLLSASPHAHFCSETLSAQNMIPLAYQQFEKQQFVDVAYFEPLYGKEYVAAKPHVKGLR